MIHSCHGRIALDKLDAITDVPELVQSQVKDPGKWEVSWRYFSISLGVKVFPYLMWDSNLISLVCLILLKLFHPTVSVSGHLMVTAGTCIVCKAHVGMFFLQASSTALGGHFIH